MNSSSFIRPLGLAGTAGPIGSSDTAALSSPAMGHLDGAQEALRADVEPNARGLSVQAHADRVLDALRAAAAERA